ncbi:MAG: tRNA (guanosine(37)-N1)-methyltransferase TrmD [Patescibacteria group bacterium]|nr:tRNA (guanosine(37)-N1)-methyltransferase TrmD [Patescibacteria group bacterium]
MITFDVITIFPEVFDPYLKTSILGRAQKKKLIKVNLINLRRFTTDNHRTVDDTPFGGGPGMVLKIEPIYKAVQSLKAKSRKILPAGRQVKTRVILFSPRGKKFNQKTAKRLSKYDQLILISGRYEGVDERVAKHIADEEISIGDYILSGGELPALVLIEAVSRHVSGVLGKKESLEEIKGSYPVYTRPAEFTPKDSSTSSPQGKTRRGLKVPKVLLSGNHKKIDEWRKKHSS